MIVSEKHILKGGISLGNVLLEDRNIIGGIYQESLSVRFDVVSVDSQLWGLELSHIESSSLLFRGDGSLGIHFLMQDSQQLGRLLYTLLAWKYRAYSKY
jgi:hypothetical protein